MCCVSLRTMDPRYFGTVNQAPQILPMRESCPKVTAVVGVPVSNGMKMAVEEINAAGGIQGRKL
jgi:hypothetical protein